MTAPGGPTVVNGYLLDTSVTSLMWSAGHPEHAGIMTRVGALNPSDELFVSVLTFGEMEDGLHKPGSALDARQKEEIRSAMRAHRLLLDVTQEIAEVYGALRAGVFHAYGPKDGGRRKTRRPESLSFEPEPSQTLGVQENDLWLISTAIAHNLRFVTRDPKSQRVDRVIASVFPAYTLRPLDWTSPPGGGDGRAPDAPES